MKKLYIILISIIFVSSGFTQEKLQEKNVNKVQTEYSKDKAKQVNAVNKEVDNKENKIFGSAKSSGTEVKLEKGKNNNSISNNELRKNLNNPKKMKK